MREIRTYGSEGGGSLDLPTPITPGFFIFSRLPVGLQQLWNCSNAPLA